MSLGMDEIARAIEASRNFRARRRTVARIDMFGAPAFRRAHEGHGQSDERLVPLEVASFPLAREAAKPRERPAEIGTEGAHMRGEGQGACGSSRFVEQDIFAFP